MTDAEIGKAVREWVHPEVAESLFSNREEIHRWLDRMRWHVERIAKTRSAQPEIIRCKDCKHYQFADNRAFGMPVKMCEWFGFEDVDEDDFCSRADKKSDFCPNFGSDNRGEQE